MWAASDEILSHNFWICELGFFLIPSRLAVYFWPGTCKGFTFVNFEEHLTRIGRVFLKTYWIFLDCHDETNRVLSLIIKSSLLCFEDYFVKIILKPDCLTIWSRRNRQINLSLTVHKDFLAITGYIIQVKCGGSVVLVLYSQNKTGSSMKLVNNNIKNLARTQISNNFFLMD